MRWYESAEKSLVGLAVTYGATIIDEAELRAEDFYHVAHQEIWRACLALHEAGKPVDLTLIHGELARVGKLKAVDAVIDDSISAHGLPALVEDYAAEVRKASLTRRVCMELSEVMHKGKSGLLEGEDLVGEALRVTSVLSTASPSKARGIGDCAELAVLEMQKMQMRKDAGEAIVSGLPTGLTDLDEILGGIPTGVVTILGGRPSMGKSALARGIAAHIAGQGLGVHVFSMEDTASDYAKRQLADGAHVDLGRLHKLALGRSDLTSIAGEGDRLRSLNGHWLVDDVAGLSSSQVAARVRRHKREIKTRLVVVDYAQLMNEPDAPSGDKGMSVGLAAERLQRLAREEDLAVVLLSQLNRECDKRPDKRPMLEQVANVVIFCYRDEVYNPETKERGVGEILIRKNKNGGTGHARLAWDGPTATYRNLARRDYTQPRYEAEY
jgi:replicative DNA helicase